MTSPSTSTSRSSSRSSNPRVAVGSPRRRPTATYPRTNHFSAFAQHDSARFAGVTTDTARQPLGAGRVVAIAFVVLLNIALLVVIGWLVTHRDRVSDQFAVWNFTPDSTISSYAQRSAM